MTQQRVLVLTATIGLFVGCSESTGTRDGDAAGQPTGDGSEIVKRDASADTSADTSADGDAAPWSVNDGATSSDTGDTSPVTARRVFFDDFETGNLSKWTDGSAPVVEVAADGQAPHAGTKMAACSWNGVVAWNHPESHVGMHLRTWPYTTEMFVRFWIRLDADMDDKDGAKLYRMPFSQDNQGNEILWQRDVTSGGQHEIVSANSDPIVNIWGCRSLEDRQWHKVEYYLKDAQDGVLRTWIDGKEVTCKNSSGKGYPFIGDTHRNSAGWAGVYFASNWSSNPGWEHDATNHMYIDDFEVYSDAATGTPATGSLQDGTVTVIP